MYDFKHVSCSHRVSVSLRKEKADELGLLWQTQSASHSKVACFPSIDYILKQHGLLFACQHREKRLTIILLPVGDILWAYSRDKHAFKLCSWVSCIFLIGCPVLHCCKTCHPYVYGSKQHRKPECRFSWDIRVHVNVRVMCGGLRTALGDWAAPFCK